MYFACLVGLVYLIHIVFPLHLSCYFFYICLNSFSAYLFLLTLSVSLFLHPASFYTLTRSLSLSLSLNHSNSFLLSYSLSLFLYQSLLLFLLSFHDSNFAPFSFSVSLPLITRLERYSETQGDKGSIEYHLWYPTPLCFNKSLLHAPTYLPTYLPTSVTRLGDLLDFGQLFKARGNNQFTQISRILRQFL